MTFRYRVQKLFETWLREPFVYMYVIDYRRENRSVLSCMIYAHSDLSRRSSQHGLENNTRKCLRSRIDRRRSVACIAGRFCTPVHEARFLLAGRVFLSCERIFSVLGLEMKTKRMRYQLRCRKFLRSRKSREMHRSKTPFAKNISHNAKRRYESSSRRPKDSSFPNR